MPKVRYKAKGGHKTTGRRKNAKRHRTKISKKQESGTEGMVKIMDQLQESFMGLGKGKNIARVGYWVATIAHSLKRDGFKPYVRELGAALGFASPEDLKEIRTHLRDLDGRILDIEIKLGIDNNRHEGN